MATLDMMDLVLTPLFQAMIQEGVVTKDALLSCLEKLETTPDIREHIANLPAPVINGVLLGELTLTRLRTPHPDLPALRQKVRAAIGKQSDGDDSE